MSQILCFSSQNFLQSCVPHGFLIMHCFPSSLLWQSFHLPLPLWEVSSLEVELLLLGGFSAHGPDQQGALGYLLVQDCQRICEFCTFQKIVLTIYIGNTLPCIHRLTTSGGQTNPIDSNQWHPNCPLCKFFKIVFQSSCRSCVIGDVDVNNTQDNAYVFSMSVRKLNTSVIGENMRGFSCYTKSLHVGCKCSPNIVPTSVSQFHCLGPIPEGKME